MLKKAQCFLIMADNHKLLTCFQIEITNLLLLNTSCILTFEKS